MTTKFSAHHVSDLAQLVDDVARNVITQMSPLEIGLMVDPHATSVKLKPVPVEVMNDHLTRYTKAELKRGEFFRFGDRFTFFVDHKVIWTLNSARADAQSGRLMGKGGSK